MTRTCATPGCRFRDAHDGPHSHENCGRRFRKTVWMKSRTIGLTKACAPPVHTRCVAVKQPNDFQLGIGDVRTAIDGQRGVRLRMSKTAFCGHWPDAKDVCTGKLLGPSYEGKFVAEALFDGDTEPTLLTSSSLMLTDTHVYWRKPHMDASILLKNKCTQNSKHVNAMARAAEMYEVLCDSVVDLGGRLVVTLDGMGTNRVSGDDVLQSVAPRQRPDTLTLEMSADVALAQRICLGFGTKVRFTGADPNMTRRAVKKMGTPTIEDVLMTSGNTILSEEEKRRVVWLNLDYCGGPPKNHSVDACATMMETCLAHLSDLQMVTVTMAKRNHANLDERFADYFPTPYGFRIAKTFTDNARVVCKMYRRDTTFPRHVSIPGGWWKNAPREWKMTTFDGVVVGKTYGDMYDVYVPYDGARYQMRGDAVSAYATP